MRLLLRFVFKTVINAVAIAVAVRWIPGFEVLPRAFVDLSSTGIPPIVQSFAVIGIALALLNLILRPILKLISLPFIVITLGLFHIVINAALLYLADWYVAELAIHGPAALFLGSLLIGIANAII